MTRHERPCGPRRRAAGPARSASVPCPAGWRGRAGPLPRRRGSIWPQPVLPRRTWWLSCSGSGITLGCIGLTMLHHLVGGSGACRSAGRWRRARSPCSRWRPSLFPLVARICRSSIPGLGPKRSGSMRELAHKAAYLNVGLSSSAVRHSTSSSGSRFAAMLRRLVAAPRTRTPILRPSRWLQHLSGPGLVLLFLTSTFAAIDWGMSLEPKWSSTIYGAMLMIGRSAVDPRDDDRDRDLAGVRPAR